jgi:hypothetical protein
MTAILEDPGAEHQIRLILTPPLPRVRGGHKVQVSCTCRRTPGRYGARPRHLIIEARKVFPAADAIAVWRAWHKERGVTV